MRKFFWCGNQDEFKWPLISWEKIFKSKVLGGAGLKDWRRMNLAMGAKLVWNIYEEPNKLWVKIIREKYLGVSDDEGIIRIRDPPRGSTIWNFILDCRKVIHDHTSWNIGDGKKALFWKDSWNDYSPLLNDAKFVEISSLMTDLWGIIFLTILNLRILGSVCVGCGKV